MKEEIKNKYPPDSAGRRMTEKVPVFLAEDKISTIREILIKRAGEFKTLNYIYVVDEGGKLRGVLSIKEVFQKPGESMLKDLMVKEIIKVKPHTDQERVAILALQHNLKSIPVVNKDDKFLGIVSSNTILDILHSEHVEDFLKLAGIHGPLAKTLRGSAIFLAKIRTPWLILGLFGGILAAQIVNFFETPLKTHFILAAFIPLIVYMADAVGTQTETLFIRNLVLDSQFGIRKYLFREIRVSFLIALVLGILLSFLSIFCFGSPYFIGLILGISLFFTVLSAILIGIFIPFLFQKLKKDPAIGSGPFGTILRDVVSLLIYFSLASIMLKLF